MIEGRDHLWIQLVGQGSPSGAYGLKPCGENALDVRAGDGNLHLFRLRSIIHALGK